MNEHDQPRRQRKGIYLLPNLFTTGTLFGGFFAIVSAMNGHFSMAAAGILAAMIADALDGRIARLTNTQSDFGKEYDSLCDMVAFGVAASVVMYAFSLHHLADYKWLGGKLGWVVAFLFTACTALRLARFNVLAAIAGSNKDFFGLPSPAAAAVITFFVWTAHSNGLDGATLLVPATVLTVVIALLMVSNFRYSSFKQIKLAERVPFFKLLVAVGLIVLVATNPPLVLFLTFFGYALSAPLAAAWRRYRGRPTAV
ncbi:CDP-diacylglycerol--serine O-phosphatidyltransferase [Flagellatimonas centrodinii]|uniref:CDP-diacylglycerol--serine O-phosphatidyltransferase n=1 Tax=Flagellatimonas centrodinii TaxID=2806210 RepID=UPI001FEE4B0C|nr:CDP-diacylglycerol--serine O-phosphatidyltransferase [Flagellatimonas centrodinii]ULQ46096.1 CDP-diacylglycerol--serine O-phosphatidyltransferase [Flagellatimonas centrodinii]